jgi:Co/Zn/Cd efflux system component
MILGIGILIQPIYLLSTNNIPDAFNMGVFGLLALIANTISFLLLMAYRDGDINMRATWICTRNDMINNVGVLIAAGLVYWFSSPLPDIIIGLIIAVIVMRSAWGVIREAKSTLNKELE